MLLTTRECYLLQENMLLQDDLCYLLQEDLCCYKRTYVTYKRTLFTTREHVTYYKMIYVTYYKRSYTVHCDDRLNDRPQSSQCDNTKVTPSWTLKQTISSIS